MGIDLIEQPVSAQDNAALVRPSHHIETAILADEAVATYFDGYRSAQQGFSGAFALKIAKAGGPASVLAPAHVAQAAGIGLYGGTMLEGPWAPSHRCTPGRRRRCNGAAKCWPAAAQR